jgi:hypothetical protein
MTFCPRWKEELVCSCDYGTFVLEMPMGVTSVYFPPQEAWAVRAPDWAKPYWLEIHQQLMEWCVSESIPLYIDETADVYA